MHLCDRPAPNIEFERSLRKLGAPAKKIDRVCRIMHTQGIDSFAQMDQEIRKAIVEDFPNLGPLVEAFEQRIFWPRNSVLHAENVSYGEKLAWDVYEVASLAVSILRRMELAKWGAIG